jgi:hypothetical protein
MRRGLAKGGEEEARNDFLLIGSAVVIANQTQIEVRVFALLLEFWLLRDVAHGNQLKAM